MIGGDSLKELRSSFILADQERCGGLSPHVSPMAHVKDCGSLLQRAGFTLPTVDIDTIVCPYPDMFTLMHHLQAMGENNAIKDRRLHVPRDVFTSAASVYKELYEDKATGLIPATFQIIYMIGWSPDASQFKPLPRGSAQNSMKDLEA
jgi:NADH dehydrogenase [ubiquinone] 1 alpha subcomplex assembly factor 5